jgi:hypothetical protein
MSNIVYNIEFHSSKEFGDGENKWEKKAEKRNFNYIKVDRD